jgi:hypothetical protein
MLANIHKDEMVLPARHSAALRDMLEGGGAGTTSVNIAINAADTKSVARLFNVNGSALKRAIKCQIRDLAFLSGCRFCPAPNHAEFMHQT